MGWGGYICVVKDNVTGNEFIVGRAIEAIAICFTIIECFWKHIFKTHLRIIK
jgi:hypothetical protein